MVNSSSASSDLPIARVIWSNGGEHARYRFIDISKDAKQSRTELRPGGRDIRRLTKVRSVESHARVLQLISLTKPPFATADQITLVMHITHEGVSNFVPTSPVIRTVNGSDVGRRYRSLSNPRLLAALCHSARQLGDTSGPRLHSGDKSQSPEAEVSPATSALRPILPPQKSLPKERGRETRTAQKSGSQKVHAKLLLR